MAITEIITAFPDAPNSSDTPEDFNSKADAFVAHQADSYVGEVNTWAVQANDTQETINGDAASAESAAKSAEDAAASASNSANFKGTWSAGTTYTIPSSVIYNDIYYNVLQNSTGDQPDISPAFWVESNYEAVYVKQNKNLMTDNVTLGGNDDGVSIANFKLQTGTTITIQNESKLGLL